MHIRENQQHENSHFKLFSAVLFLTPHLIQPPKNLKTEHQKKEILIKKTLYISTPAKINIKSVQVM